MLYETSNIGLKIHLGGTIATAVSITKPRHRRFVKACEEMDMSARADEQV